MNLLEQLKQYTDVVADTGDVDQISKYQPLDATTNPSLLYKAASLPRYAQLLNQCIDSAGDLSHTENIQACADAFAVGVASELLQKVPGYVSLEVDAHLAFDQQATYTRAKSLLQRLQENQVDTQRILIKVAATWEGIQAAKQLESEGIKCNLTLIFSFAQACACADAKAFLISPFVGRILDWYLKDRGVDAIAVQDDPGVVSVNKIYRYFKQHGIKTVVMGASFRTIDQIIHLAGCDKLTIGPSLLETLSNSEGSFKAVLSADNLGDTIARQDPSEAHFRWHMNEDPMATEKLAEGIRVFAQDQRKFEQLLCAKFAHKSSNPSQAELA